MDIKVFIVKEVDGVWILVEASQIDLAEEQIYPSKFVLAEIQEEEVLVFPKPRAWYHFQIHDRVEKTLKRKIRVKGGSMTVDWSPSNDYGPIKVEIIEELKKWLYEI